MKAVDSLAPPILSEDDLPSAGKPPALVRAERTAWRLANVDFPWDINKALEFALLRTYAVPSISALLERTGEFQARTLKRYDDTALLIREVLANGLDSGRARRAFERINDMHGRFRITNDDFRYVLSTFIFTPIDWLDNHGRRGLSEIEREAWFAFWCEFGRRMGITDLFIDIAAYRDFALRFEAERFAPAPSNRSIAQPTIDLVLSMYGVPRLLHPAGRQLVMALCEPHLVRALGYPEPSPLLRRIARSAVAVRRHVLQALPPNRRPNPPTFGRRTYPEGYNIEELGTFRRSITPQPGGPSRD